MTLNFTVGPVQSEEYVCAIGGEQVPYFRNDDFSNIVFESEDLLKRLLNAPNDSRAIFITGSGTAAMEASIINIFSQSDKLMIVNGGSFGTRFIDICKVHNIDYTEIKLPFGSDLTKDDLESSYDSNVTGFLINVNETSSGVRYDMDVVSLFCKKHNLILVADIISSFLADENDMIKHHVDAYIISSQKALACQPGVSMLVLSNRALNRIELNKPRCYYLDLKIAIDNSKRGQTPFTPAVGIIRQIHARLSTIDKNGGIETEIEHVKENALFVRECFKEFPLDRVTDHPSNSVTAYYTRGISANKLNKIMKDEYDIWICPNGGIYADKVFRIGHMGDLGIQENQYMIDSMRKAISKLMNEDDTKKQSETY